VHRSIIATLELPSIPAVRKLAVVVSVLVAILVHILVLVLVHELVLVLVLVATAMVVTTNETTSMATRM